MQEDTMSPFPERAIRFLRAHARRYRRARSGQVAVTLALVAMPILFASAAAIDYGRRNAAKARLDAALDGAVLAVMSQKTNTITSTNLQNMETQFRTEAAKVPGVTVTSFNPGTPINGTSTVSLTASYTATVKTSLASMMKVASMNIGASASSTRNLFQYINFYLLLDNSPSMGLAATDTDVNNMKNATPDRCAFACHEHTYDSQGNVTGDNLNDYYHIAQKNNIKLRIQVLRDAVSALVDQANASMSLSQQFQMEMWTFNDSTTQTRLQAMTPTLSQIKTAAANIDIAYAYYNQSDNQTDFERAIAKMNAAIPASGIGTSSASPIRLLFLVTDGVEDTGGTVTNQSAGFQISGNRFIGPFSPSTCNALKSNNVRIGIVYTQYLPIYDNPFYNAYVQPYENQIGPMLKACASDGLYFPVASGGDITAAMLQLFSTAVASVRLSN
ncbi:pilus assembly protein TadG-related protein [Methylobacterium sp. E-005]|uniref:TadE/TadG family type IV pilus assembly protein n=1 Tax=Methylobacterium sp. E-005 TaxID=2836549 RepID=UPI001FB88D70|nr:TadE/TadG family type IV pilus assembly protein [Methylobacterium sp. E-005]MCJ2085912.1 pilus assembly protein TadG-related protein [Methylobacterium sp. E-005]